MADGRIPIPPWLHPRIEELGIEQFMASLLSKLIEQIKAQEGDENTSVKVEIMVMDGDGVQHTLDELPDEIREACQEQIEELEAQEHSVRDAFREMLRQNAWGDYTASLN